MDDGEWNRMEWTIDGRKRMASNSTQGPLRMWRPFVVVFAHNPATPFSFVTVHQKPINSIMVD